MTVRGQIDRRLGETSTAVLRQPAVTNRNAKNFDAHIVASGVSELSLSTAVSIAVNALKISAASRSITA